MKDANDSLGNPTDFKGFQVLKEPCNECRMLHVAHSMNVGCFTWHTLYYLSDGRC
jgi:hypothetical protein